MATQRMFTKHPRFGYWHLGHLAIILLAFAMHSPSNSFGAEPMNLDGLFALDRIAAPQLSPDGSKVVYQVTHISDAAANQRTTQLWLSNFDGTGSRQLTHSHKSDTHPQWSPDGTKILFVSNRDGAQQLYILDLSLGGEPVKVTNISTGASSGLWSPDGTQIAFSSSVRPEWSKLPFAEADAKNSEADSSSSANLVQARTFTKLFYRHWDSYVEGKRNHLFVINSDGSNCRNVTPGDRDAIPTSSTFSGGDEFTFSPDGKHLLFTATPAQGEGWSTNHDICRVSIANSDESWQPITSGPAAEGLLRFSPDGKWAAYRAQSKPGYEADRWQLIVCACNADGTFNGTPVSWTESLDSSVNDFHWLNNDEILILSDANASSALFRAKRDQGIESLTPPFPGNRMGQLQGSSIRGNKFVLARATINEPSELFTGEIGGPVGHQITQHNAAVLSRWERPAPESVSVPVEGDVSMQMWILKPPGFNPDTKWPVVYLIHGGPQGAWEDGWSFRWCPQLWAAQGYVVVLPNPRGSVSFGQKFCDEISRDWGGKCYRDLVKGLEFVKGIPYIDSSRISSAGASFGGYMQNWFAVSDIAKEFKCFITHCSVYNLESMWGTTDELWFDEYEQGGTPWERPANYLEYSPHRFAGNLSRHRVPMLVIHNDLDFRCPIGQGHELFQALQRQGIESRFVNFPDEGHWVNKPANCMHWHREVFAWLNKYCPPGGK